MEIVEAPHAQDPRYTTALNAERIILEAVAGGGYTFDCPNWGLYIRIGSEPYE